MFSNPQQNLKAIPLRDSDIVADLGAGSGFYTIAAGHMVPHGKVYAVELEKDFLPTIKNKAKDAGLKNVECFWGDVEKVGGSRIGDNIIDVVIASNVLFQVHEKDKFLTEAKRILKPKGKLLLVDWADTKAIPQKNAIPKSSAREMLERKGFNFEREIPAGDHHYGMIFKKA
jgi:ubiquinone/menaquinone biosynthesis C-methylase UbiE